MSANALAALYAELEQTAKEIEERNVKINALQRAIDVLENFASDQPAAMRVVSTEYQGSKTYDAVLDFMTKNNLQDIKIEDLKTELMKRGAYLGNNVKRQATMIKIALKQNNKEGRKDAIYDEGTDMVVRKDTKRRTD